MNLLLSHTNTAKLQYMISDDQIKSFQTLWRNRFGQDISRQEAYEKGVKLLRLVELTYEPMTEAEFELVQKRRKETVYDR